MSSREERNSALEEVRRRLGQIHNDEVELWLLDLSLDGEQERLAGELARDPLGFFLRG